MRRVDDQERRARLGRRLLLAGSTRAADPATVAAAVVGLHATDPASVFLGVRARLQVPDVRSVERALYDERRLVRIMGMRRTMFVVPVDLAPVVHAAVTRPLAGRERRRLAEQLEQGGIARDGDRWLRAVEEATLDSLRARGEATAAQLAEDVPGLREQLVFGVGRKWEGRQGVSGRVLYVLAAAGLVVRGRSRGSWTSTQYRWALMEGWLPGGLPDLPAAAARTELARRWLASHGPAPAADLRWWTGWTAAHVRDALAACPWPRSGPRPARRSCWTTTWSPSPRPSRGWRSCRRSTPR